MATPREIPILFSGPMVHAILEGRKTETRRVIVPRRGSDVASLRWGVGDRLWVREAWAMIGGRVVHRAGSEHLESIRASVVGWDRRWRPSIHMARTSCRIWLRVVGVEVQRLHDMTEDDARAEGIQGVEGPGGDVGTGGKDGATHLHAFAALWDGINGDRGFGWTANPLVAVVRFRPLTIYPTGAGDVLR